MKLQLVCCFALTCFFNSAANAFIPTSKTIFSRCARQHGKGAFVVDADVSVKAEGEPFVVHEKWIVSNAESMRLTVTPKAGDDFRLNTVYRGNRKTVSDNGSPRTTQISAEFFEPYFYYRTSASLQSSLIKAKVLPSDFGRVSRKIEPLDPKDEDSPLTSTDEPYVRLSRSGGVVDYALGKLTDNSQGSPGVWFEQDAFSIRKIKFPSFSEVDADQYQTFPNQLVFPRDRTVKWGANSATIHVTSIRPLTDQEAAKAMSAATPQTISASKNDNALLREFYSRFR